MTGKGKRKQDNGVLATNRKAFHDYTILEKLEVGIALVGTEVKVLRGGGVGLTGAYVRVENGSLWLMQANFPPYSFGNRFNHESLRPRRLLAHKREIRRCRLQEQKADLIPLRFYVARKPGGSSWRSASGAASSRRTSARPSGAARRILMPAAPWPRTVEDSGGDEPARSPSPSQPMNFRKRKKRTTTKLVNNDYTKRTGTTSD